MRLIVFIFCILSILAFVENVECRNEQTPDDFLNSGVGAVQTCHFLIPFSFDISTKLTAAQFKSMKSFLLDPFLSSLFPVDIQPAPFSTYSEQNYVYRRPRNVSGISNFIANEAQGTSTYSFIIRPLKYFVDQNVVALATSDLAVNTIIFAGNSLAAGDVQTVQSYASTLTANGNMLTVVLVNPNIDQTNYRQITGLNIVVWNNTAALIDEIRTVMNCSASSSTVTTTMLTTTAPTSTQPPPTTIQTTTTVVPSTTTTVTSNLTETTTTSSTTIPSSTSTTTSTSTTRTPPTSTSTITSTVVTSPSTSETTTVGTTSTTTTPISVCHSLIPFSFDVATDLTAAEFADLKIFLVNLFLSELFPLDVQPAWYSTYDNTNQGYDRPNNVSDIATTVQNLSQSTATTSDFIQPLQYFVDRGVAEMGSSDGLPVNTIILAGSPLTDVDTAVFLAPWLTTNGNTLTVVLVNPNIDQTNYRQVIGLNIVVWSDPVTTLVAIKNVMNCQALSTTSVVTSTTTITTTPNPTTTTQATTAAPTTTTYPRPIDIVVVLDGSLCSSGIGNLNAQVAVLDKIFQKYTFGLNVRVAFANPINMDIQTTFVCDMASINVTIQTINQYCASAILDPQQRLNDSLIESMNALYNQHSPALAFLVLLQSNGTVYTNETDSVVGAAITFRENCLEPTNAKVVVVQVDNFYPVGPALASDGFFFNNTEDIGTRVAESFIGIHDYNPAAYTCTTPAATTTTTSSSTTTFVPTTTNGTTNAEPTTMTTTSSPTTPAATTTTTTSTTSVTPSPVTTVAITTTTKIATTTSSLTTTFVPTTNGTTNPEPTTMTTTSSPTTPAATTTTTTGILTTTTPTTSVTTPPVTTVATTTTTKIATTTSSSTTTPVPTANGTTNAEPTTMTTTTTATTTTSTVYPRPIDIAVVLDGSVCALDGDLNEQVAVLEKIFQKYTFGLHVRVSFANPINMDFESTFVCDMATINATIQSINQYCAFTDFLDPQQHLNDSIIESMNALYNQNNPALAFLVLLQSNGSVNSNDAASVVAATKTFRENCLEPTNAKVVVVQVDDFYPVDPALASDGFFFNNTEDIGTRVAESFIGIQDYNPAGYTCGSTNSKNFASVPSGSTCYPNS